ncbi:hypothetical protein OQA88_7494 [Cercophora sp. LCS_1]
MALRLLVLALAGTSLATPFRRADCTRESLLAAADAYVAAQTAGSLDPLSGFVAANWTFEENNKVIPASKSVVATKKLKIDSRRTNTDLVQCATYTELIAADPSAPYVIGTQIRHDSSGKITLIDSVASTTGSWLFNAAKTLQYAKAEKWDTIPENKWDSREAIQAAGDAYMDLWSSSTAEAKIPWGKPCNRLEGGAYTGSGKADDSCAVGIPSNHNQLPNTRRRYVIDQSMGSVSILCVWEHMMNAADQHEFRLEGGKLRV